MTLFFTQDDYLTAGVWAACGQTRLISSLALFLVRSENAYVKMLRGIDFKCNTLFGTHRNFISQVRMTCQTMFGALRKRTCQLRLTSSLIAYSARTEGAHVKYD